MQRSSLRRALNCSGWGLIAALSTTSCALPQGATPPVANAVPSTAAAHPALPATDAQVTLSVQDPGAPPRDLVVSLYYPKSHLSNVTADTGLMLDLHNWGGKDLDGAPNPITLANNYNVISIAVRYYQSSDPDKGPIPYDFGYIQACDALRALQYVYGSLTEAKMPFDATRIYGTGGSGGGNVIEMANKFAPHTFACIVDLSGMASLTDDIAYNMPGGSALNARYSRDPASSQYLTKGMQEIRDIGNPAHLAEMAKLGNGCQVVMIHGDDDPYCLITDTQRVAAAMQAAGLKVETHFFAKTDIDGKIVKNTGHSIGNRTTLLVTFAGDYLTPGNAKMCRLTSGSDFARRDKVTYDTSDARYSMDFSGGTPVLGSEKKP